MDSVKTDPSLTDGFEALVAPFLGAAYNTAVRLTGCRADAEDLVQEAAVRAFRGRDTMPAAAEVRAWFFRILIGLYFDRCRAAPRPDSVPAVVDTPELYLFGQTAAHGLHGRFASPADALMDRLDEECVAQAMASLPPQYRVIATLHFVNQMTYSEIAETLELPIGAVRSRLHRGRRMMQRSLWNLASTRGLVTDLEGKDL